MSEIHRRGFVVNGMRVREDQKPRFFGIVFANNAVGVAAWRSDGLGKRFFCCVCVLIVIAIGGVIRPRAVYQPLQSDVSKTAFGDV